MIFVVLLAIVGAFLVFSLFSIFKVLTKSNNTVKAQEAMYDVPYNSSIGNESSEHVSDNSDDAQYKQLREPVNTELKMPDVPGQSNEELAAPEPLQQKVDTKVDVPSPSDSSEKIEDNALFGSNLRHPEGMIQPANSMSSLESEIASGVASRTVNNTNTNEYSFSADMAQNGGEFMKGISAFDGTDTGSMFSSL
jgi:hypothetical protein